MCEKIWGFSGLGAKKNRFFKGIFSFFQRKKKRKILILAGNFSFFPRGNCCCFHLQFLSHAQKKSKFWENFSGNYLKKFGFFSMQKNSWPRKSPNFLGSHFFERFGSKFSHLSLKFCSKICSRKFGGFRVSVQKKNVFWRGKKKKKFFFKGNCFICFWYNLCPHMQKKSQFWGKIFRKLLRNLDFFRCKKILGLGKAQIFSEVTFLSV